AGAVIAAADGYRTEAADGPPGRGSGGFAVGLLVPLLCLLLFGGAVVVGLVLWNRARRRPAPVAADPNDPHPGVPTQQLSDRANTLLVELDDAVRTSERELVLAREQYGAEATTTFEAA